MLKHLLISFTAVSMALTSANTLAESHSASNVKPAVQVDFKQQLAHANFLPSLMPKLLRGFAKDNPFKLTKEQFSALDGFHKHHMPKMKKMVAALTEAESEAKRMMIENYPPKKVNAAGIHSLNIRADIMTQKIQCRSYVRSVLSPEQYKNFMTSQ